MHTRCSLLVTAVVGLFSITAAAADWPQWRGPHRDGISQGRLYLRDLATLWCYDVKDPQASR